MLSQLTAKIQTAFRLLIFPRTTSACSKGEHAKTVPFSLFVATGRGTRTPVTPITPRGIHGITCMCKLVEFVFLLSTTKNTRNLPQKMILLKITSLTASLKVAILVNPSTLCANSSTSFSLCSVANLPPLLDLEDLV